MTKPKRRTPTSAAPDDDTTMTGALEPGEKKGGRAIRLPGGKHSIRHVLGATGEELAQLSERPKARRAAECRSGCGAVHHRGGF